MLRALQNRGQSNPFYPMHPSPHDASARVTKLQRVWDAPVRIVHACFIAAVTGAWLTRGAERADWHAAFGYLALAALAFRIAWGFIGPPHARFSGFAYSPRRAIEYVLQALRGAPRHYTGHNPAGSWAVYVLLLLVAAICVSGVIASGGVHQLGPVAGAVSFAIGDISLELH